MKLQLTPPRCLPPLLIHMQVFQLAKFIAKYPDVSLQELFKRKKLKDNTFICLHEFQNEVVILHLVCSSSSVVDHTQVKYTLWNCTWNCSVSPIRQGGEIYFIMTNMELYLLLWQNEEVWKYGNRPEPPHAATSVSYSIFAPSLLSTNVTPSSRPRL
jgi:hypothetical protein